jgi:predicted acyltransferase
MTVQQAVVDSGSADRVAGAVTDSAPRGSSGGRLASIDALRGFDMFWIIGGATVFGSLADVWPNPLTFGLRRQLEHVRWEGVHFYDLIYPLFLLLIGTVLPFSLSRRQAQGEKPGRVYLHFLKRSVVLIILSSIPGGLLNFTKWPYLGGVLAHIGLCYLPAAILVRHTG